MKIYSTQELRNLGIVGHGDAGKTSLVAAMLFATGATSRLGRVDEGTAPTDYDEEEIARKISLNITSAYVEHKGSKINLIDTPGYAAFIAHARPALRICETALFVVDAVSGVGIQTEKAWEYADELQRPRPRFIVINKLDKERADFGATLDALRERFGHSCVPLTLPIGAEKNFRGVVDVVRMKAYEFDAGGKPKEIPLPEEGRGYVDETHEKLVEAVAESDEALMEKFFEAGTLTDEEFIGGMRKAILSRSLTPVFAASSANMIGVMTLLDAIVDYAPNPADLGQIKAKAGPDAGAEEVERAVSDSQPPAAYVFRTVVESFGKMTVMKVWSGQLKSDATLYNIGKGAQERLGPLHLMQGKNVEKIAEAHTGDIVAVTKLKETETGDTLCDKANAIYYEPVKFPEAAINFAIQPKSRADEDKLSGSIHKDQGVRTRRLQPAARRGVGGQAQKPLSRRGGAASAQSALPRDHQGARRGARSSQEADRRSRPVRRLQMHLRAFAARRGLRVQGQNLRRRDPSAMAARRREGNQGFSRSRGAGRLPGSGFQGRVDRRLLPHGRFRRFLVPGGGAQSLQEHDREGPPCAARTDHERRGRRPAGMLRRHHGRNQFAPRAHSRHGFEGDEPDRQGHRADGRDADLPPIAQLDHLGARVVLDGVLPLRRGAGPLVAKDRAAGCG